MVNDTSVQSHSGSYKGRFAPSPSGPLHFGSLVAALGSFLDARSSHGQWFVRIEDLDPPREVAGAADQILRQLEHYGLEWDSCVSYQSQHYQQYRATIDELTQQQRCYRCVCTRKQIQAYGGVYNNRCRTMANTTLDSSVRFVNQSPVLSFSDRRLGHITFPQERAHEDFIIQRRDTLYAYHLAMVVDDIDLGITDVVRGADLVEPTACQLALYKGLQHPAPNYLHLPLALGSPGNKLSKHNYAPAIVADKPLETLFLALQFLQQPLLPLADYGSHYQLLEWATTRWDPTLIPETDSVVSQAVVSITCPPD